MLHSSRAESLDSLCLQVVRRLGKKSFMKALSGTVKFVALAGVAVAAIITLRTFAQTSSSTPTLTDPKMPPEPDASQATFVLKIKNRHLLKDDSDAGEAAFAALLSNGHYETAKGNRIHLRHRRAQWGEHYFPQDRASWPPPSPPPSPHAQLNIKTDKVTVSEAARSLANGELTSISPHVTQLVASHNAADITAVLDQLK